MHNYVYLLQCSILPYRAKHTGNRLAVTKCYCPIELKSFVCANIKHKILTRHLNVLPLAYRASSEGRPVQLFAVRLAPKLHPVLKYAVMIQTFRILMYISHRTRTGPRGYHKLRR